MTRVRRWMTGVLAGAVVLAAVGCGGDDGDDAADAYVGALNAAQDAFVADVARVAAARDEQAALAAYTVAAEDAATAIQAIDPPKEVAVLHGRLVEGFDTFARETADAEAALTSGDLDRVLTAQQELIEATETQEELVRTTVAEINEELQAG